MRYCWILLLLLACGPRTAADCRREGEGTMRALVHQLEQCECRDDLLAREAKLKKLYTRMADLMLAADGLGGSGEPPDEELNRRLRDELVRVYALPGGRDIVERAQGEALHRLSSQRVETLAVSSESVGTR